MRTFVFGALVSRALPLLRGAPLVLVFALALGSASAANPVPERGLLWKIESPGRQASYLFGTMHSSDPRILALLPSLEPFITSSRTFSMELLFNGRAFITMGESMYFNDGRTLPAVIGKDLYARTLRVVAGRGLSTEGLEHKKPWAVMLTLGAKEPEGELFLDLALMRAAVAADKGTYGLETMEEQVGVFDQMSLEDQTTLLADTLKLSAMMDSHTKMLTDIYLSGDLSRLMRFAEQQNGPGKANKLLLDRLLTERNVRMADRMRARIDEGGAFLAVGALHLPGPHGLLRLLRDRGYRVTPVPLGR